MAKQISSLSVGLFGNVAPFAAAFGAKALKPLNSFVAGVGNASKSIAKFAGIGGAISGIIGGAGIGFLVQQQMEAIDASAKLSDRLGLSTEAVAGFQHAADLAGVSGEHLTGGLEKMLKKLGTANVEGGADADAFTQLGLDPKALAAMGSEEAFLQIGEALNKIKDPAERAFAATEIFGKSGQQLLPLFGQGAEGIREAMKDAEALGLTFNRVDAAKVEEANDAITRTKSAFVGIFRTAAVQFAPFLTTAANTFTTFAQYAGTGIKAFVARIGGLYTAVAPTLARLVAGFKWAATVTVTTWTRVVGGLYNIVAPIVMRVADFVVTTYSIVAPRVMAIGQAIWQRITTVWNAVYNTVAGIVGGISNFITGHWQGILTNTTGFALATWGIIKSVFGVIFEIASSVWTGVVNIWNWATNLIIGQTATAGTEVSNSFGFITSAAGWLMDKVTLAFNVTAYAITNWRDTLKLAAVGAAYAVVKFANQAVHFFTEVIPATLTWFLNNWRDIFQTIANGTAAIVTNMFTNVTGFFSAVWSWLKGDGFDFKWTGLLDGFESTLKELPQVAERQIGPLEASLGAEADKLGEKWGNGLAAHLEAKQQEVADATKAMTDGVAAVMEPPKAPTVEAPKVEAPPEIPKPDPVTVDVGLSEDSLTVKVTPEVGKAKAVMAGSAEAQQAVALARAAAMLAKPKAPPAPKEQPKPTGGTTTPQSPAPAPTTPVAAPQAQQALSQPVSKPPALAQPTSAAEAVKPSGAMSEFASKMIEKLFDEAKKHTERLGEIVTNTADLKNISMVKEAVF